MSNSLITDKEIDEIMLPMAITFAKDLSSYSISVINAFYSHYTPVLYQRKGGLNNMWQIDFAKNGTRGYDIIATYSSEFFSASHDSDEDVFQGAFMQGYHGDSQVWGVHKKIPQMSPSPAKLIDQFVNSYSF